MPRLHPERIKNSVLRSLYHVCGSLAQARQELRWIRRELPVTKVFSAVKKRSMGMPLSYVFGTTPFGPLTLNTPRGVLIPRSETEEWVCRLASNIKHGDWKPKKVLDIGTGSGCVLLLLVCELGVSGVGMDISPVSETVFNQNCLKTGLNAQFLKHSLFEPLPDDVKVDLVVSNPPYIPQAEFWTETQPSVTIWEPRRALLGGSGTLAAVISRIFESGAQMAVIEVGNQEQIDFCVALFKTRGWAAHGEVDLAGLPRTVWARRLTT